MKAFAAGRKIPLMGPEASGERVAAAMYGLVGAARLKGLDPQAQLRYVFERIAGYPVNRVDELLTENVAPRIDATPPANVARPEPLSISVPKCSLVSTPKQAPPNQAARRPDQQPVGLETASGRLIAAPDACPGRQARARSVNLGREVHDQLGDAR